MKEELTSRERVKLTLAHKEADRVPLDFGGTAYTSASYGALKNLSNYLKIDSKLEIFSETSQDCIIDEHIQEKFHSDFRVITTNENDTLKMIDENLYQDEWKIIWKKVFISNGNYYYEIFKHPLKTTVKYDDIINYQWPDIGANLYNGLEDSAKLASDSNFAVVGSMKLASIFGIFWYLRSMDVFLMDLISNKDFAKFFMKKVIEVQEKRIIKFLEKTGKYLDVFCLCGDLGTQAGLFISPQLFREMIKPIFKEIINKVKNYTDAKIFYHSCGNVYALIEDFIECGIEILNPVQVSAKNMQTAVLKKEFGDKIIFWGGIDTQRVLPYGNVNDVENEVKLRIKEMSEGGGYILAPVHNIQNDVPPQNIVALYESGYKYGNYQLKT